MKRLILLVFGIMATLFTEAQENFPVNGVRDVRPEVYAFKNANIQTDPVTLIRDAVMVIREGTIVALGKDIVIPDEATVFDLEGHYIYPGLIDMYTTFGMPEVKESTYSYLGSPQYESGREGPYGWNDAIRAEFNAIEEFSFDTKKAESLRKQGITSVLAYRPDGIARGTSVLANLSDEPLQENIIAEKAAAHYSFDKGSSTQAYPGTFMGAVALLRQTYYDVQWYNSPNNMRQTNISLEAFGELQDLPQIVEVENRYELMVAAEVGEEFGVRYILKGNGDEYQRMQDIAATEVPLILPLDFPEAYDVEDPDVLRDLSLRQMKHWELAPKNPAFLESMGISFAFTTTGLDDGEELLKQVRKAIRYGLSEEQALRALTQTPAQLLNVDHMIGSLKAGMTANFLVVSDSLFSKDALLYENWINGKQYIITDRNIPDPEGIYELELDGKNFPLSITGKRDKKKAVVSINDTTEVKAQLKLTRDRVVLSFSIPEGGTYNLSGWWTADGFKGAGTGEDGAGILFTARYQSDHDPDTTDKDKDKATERDKKEDIPPGDLGEIIYPFTAYGQTRVPEPEDVIFRNATVWTNEQEGILAGADVLVRDGRIAAVGIDLEAEDVRVIDATGKHVTSGIIDEHSHIALRGAVNEATAALSSEVRMRDELDPEDMSMYRQLAGGVTAAQLLHGSANPVGGQSAIIKFRWGQGPSGLLIQGADPTIKFALGENVKQSNWGSSYTVRFPQTRMGVEQVYMDAFTRADAYRKAWEAYGNLSNKEKEKAIMPRKDLRLEALAEILDSERFITCHSYVQSEINMLMHVADQFGFRVNTFTHILEGYKVADKMSMHGVAGSSFSDWWGYKYEVKDAIPYNTVLMHNEGVLTAVNSDDAEMARRLNQEAAKSVKYGGMDEEDAWKMVTLNPAKMLHLDDRMGSLKAGKDADIVLWSDHPLSIYARPELTMVDGTIYYDLEKDADAREWMKREKARIAGKMLEAKKNGEPVSPVSRHSKFYWHCDDTVVLDY